MPSCIYVLYVGGALYAYVTIIQKDKSITAIQAMLPNIGIHGARQVQHPLATA